MTKTKEAAKHTPTPWNWRQSDKVVGCGIVLDGCNDTVCDCRTPLRNPFECSANAAFIVRAVNSHEELMASRAELLEVCKMALGFCQIVDHKFDDERKNGKRAYIDVLKDNLQHAIANARGHE